MTKKTYYLFTPAKFAASVTNKNLLKMFLPWLLGQPNNRQDAMNVLFHCPRSQGKSSLANYRCCKIAGIFAIGSGPLERASERERERKIE